MEVVVERRSNSFLVFRIRKIEEADFQTNDFCQQITSEQENLYTTERPPSFPSFLVLAMT